jgi:hypothetical protein
MMFREVDFVQAPSVSGGRHPPCCLDEMVCSIGGKRMHLWRPGDAAAIFDREFQ